MSLLNSKINSIDAEIDRLGGGKADSLFPVFSGVATFNGPVVFSSPAIAGLTSATVGLGNVQNIDAQAYTDRQIHILTNQAPALLNTITELATAIGNDPQLRYYYIYPVKHHQYPVRLVLHSATDQQPMCHGPRATCPCKWIL